MLLPNICSMHYNRLPWYKEKDPLSSDALFSHCKFITIDPLSKNGGGKEMFKLFVVDIGMRGVFS